EEIPCNELIGKWEWIGHGVSTTQYFLFDYKTDVFIEFQTCCLLLTYQGEEVKIREHYWITDTIEYVDNHKYYHTFVYINDVKLYYVLKYDTLFLDDPKNDIFPFSVYLKIN
ncbi:MAG: hypothetical protein MUO72_20445, partial [Bacteroidales bacterium]|nr:hypothetical protein [Bacteroidales bacterium]